MEICLKELQNKQKDFEWKRPHCDKCGVDFYGHGFVLRFFNKFDESLYLKRWRCPKCHCVITVRPRTYWSRYRELFNTIFETLIFRIKNLKWPPWTTRQRAGHWLNKLIINAKSNLLLKDSLLDTIIFYQNKKLSIN